MNSRLLDLEPSQRQSVPLVIDPIADWSLSHRSSITREIISPLILRPTVKESLHEKSSELVGRNTDARGTEISLTSLPLDEETAKMGNIDPLTGNPIVPPTFLRIRKLIDEFLLGNPCPESVQHFVRFPLVSQIF